VKTCDLLIPSSGSELFQVSSPLAIDSAQSKRSPTWARIWAGVRVVSEGMERSECLRRFPHGLRAAIRERRHCVSQHFTFWYRGLFTIVSRLLGLNSFSPIVRLPALMCYSNDQDSVCSTA